MARRILEVRSHIDHIRQKYPAAVSEDGDLSALHQIGGPGSAIRNVMILNDKDFQEYARKLIEWASAGHAPKFRQKGVGKAGRLLDANEERQFKLTLPHMEQLWSAVRSELGRELLEADQRLTIMEAQLEVWRPEDSQ